jgi:hypothetical protein
MCSYKNVLYWNRCVVRLSVRPSVRPSVSYFSAALSIVRSGILDLWPGSPGIWPWPYQEKHNVTSITRVPTIRIGHMMARLKGLSVRIIFNLRLMVIYACGLLPIRPKSQNSNIRHDGTLLIRNFMLMLKKPMDPNLVIALVMIRLKSQNTSMPWWRWWWPN